MIVGDVPFYVKIWWMMTQPFAMRRFAHRASAVTPSKN